MAGGEVDGAVELVRGEEHGRPGRSGVAHELVDQVAALLIEPGVGFVEQPEARPPHDDRRERGPAPLTGGQVPHRHVAQPLDHPEPVESAVDRALVEVMPAAPSAFFSVPRDTLYPFNINAAAPGMRAAGSAPWAVAIAALVASAMVVFA